MDIKKIDLFDDTKTVINIPKGPQFNTKWGHFLLMPALFFLVVSIVSILKIELILFFISLIICIPLFSYILDIHGLEFDQQQRKIRDYKKFLWLKIGEWYDIDNFKSIYIAKEHVVSPNLGRSGKHYNTNHYYQTLLVDVNNKKKILLFENKNYYQVLKISKFITNSTGLEFIDLVKGNKSYT